uniref:Alpha-tocopherol transfer protein-like n=1 Tax=Sipha flava TaxID=143950 RepID=A0A2S2QQE7_9HEMI
MATSKTIVLPEPDQLKKIFQDIGTTEEKIDVEVKTLVEWMRKQPHLPNPDDERRIRMFLIMCKNSLERTKESLDQYYTIKSMVPEFFSDRDPTSPSLVRSMGISIFIPLPKLTPEGHRISLSRLRDPSGIDNYEFLDYVKVNFMSIDIRLSKLDMFKKETFIFDLKHFSLSLLTTVVPHVKKFIYCATTAYPLRIHQVHIVNMPTYAQSMVNMVLGILKKKIASRVSAISVRRLSYGSGMVNIDGFDIP